VLSSLPELPHDFHQFFSKSPEARMISRKINHIFSFTQMGATSKGFIQNLPVPSAFTLQGRTYHYLPPSKKYANTALWYLLDSEYCQNTPHIQKLIKHDKLPQDFIAKISDVVLNAMKTMHNHFYDSLKSSLDVSHKILDDNNEEFQLIIHPYDKPTGVKEIASVREIPTVGSVSSSQPRTVITEWIKKGRKKKKSISILSKDLEALSYPLLFPCGTTGWHPEFAINGHRITLQKYLRQLLLREERFSLMNRLTQEFIVDMFSRMEDQRLDYLKNKQKKEIQGDETIHADGGSNQAKKYYLPGSFSGGGFRKNQMLLENGLARVRQDGPPHLFLTMTCNPNWPEIKQRLKKGQTAGNISLIVARGFHKKMMDMRKDVKILFGPHDYNMDVIEYQKRALPHDHELVSLKKDIFTTPEDIDKVICAEMPREEGKLKEAVKLFMLHEHSDRCGFEKTGTCHWGYPKPRIEHTYIDEHGYTYYRRRDPELDAWVVPYCGPLLLKYWCHFNIEHVHGALTIDYLYMYCYKLPLSVRMVLKEIHENKDYEDEINNYLKCRYVGSIEASWRILGFASTMANPAVKVLQIHLPNDTSLYSTKKGKKSCSPLMRYFFRPSGAEFEDLTFAEYYLKYITYPKPLKSGVRTFHVDKCPPSHGTSHYVHQRVKRSQKKYVRLPMMTPKAGEKYYLHLLLANFPARSFKDLRSVDGKKYRTFQEAAEAYGLLSAENEMKLAMHEAYESGSPARSLRNLFITFTMDGHPTIKLLKRLYKKMMWSDCDPKDRFNNLLQKLADRFKQLGCSMQQYNLPLPSGQITELERHRAAFDARKQKKVLRDMLQRRFSKEQRNVYDKICKKLQRHDIRSTKPCLIYIDGKFGRGKTHVLKAVSRFIRAQGKIALTCGTTGKASLHLEGGRTAHNLFNIPVKPAGLPEEDIQWEQGCNLKPGTARAELILNCAAILWDEFASANQKDVDKVNEICQELTGNYGVPFGGIPLLAAGDFEQIPPVVPRGNKDAVLHASVKNLSFWRYFKIHTLHHPQRDRVDKKHSQMVDDLGVDTYPHSTLENGDIDPILVDIPFNDIFLANREEKEFCNDIFPSEVLQNSRESSLRAIVTCRNDRVDLLNSMILEKKYGKMYYKFSTDELIDDSIKLSKSHPHVAASFKSIAFLHKSTAPGVPPHKLELKIGCICFATRNISYDEGILNNAVLEVVDIGKYIVKVRSLSLEQQTQKPAPVVDIPRISFHFYRGRSGIKIIRKQFPLRLAYARSIHRVQGDNLNRVNLDLTTRPFVHGQLKVALGRVSRGSDISACAFQQDVIEQTRSIRTNNIVYKELLIPS